jgi:hypothetical protein
MAPDPWWYGDTQIINFGLGAPTLFFPIPPVTLSPGTVQGVFTVDLSDTDAPTYPVWTITGPGSALLLANQTTGRSIEVNASLAAGESMTIDTRPGFQSVRRGDGTNLMAALASDPAMWPLIEDVNQVSASADRRDIRVPHPRGVPAALRRHLTKGGRRDDRDRDAEGERGPRLRQRRRRVQPAHRRPGHDRRERGRRRHLRARGAHDDPGPVDGTVVLSATIPCASGTNVTHVGMQTATSGGTFLDKFAGSATSTGSIAVSITVAAV